MKTINFPYIALGLCATFLLLVMKGSQVNADGLTEMPLLTLLVISEFSVFVSAIGAYIGIKHCLSVGFKPLYALVSILCILLSLRFIMLGIELWPL